MLQQMAVAQEQDGAAPTTAEVLRRLQKDQREMRESVSDRHVDSIYASAYRLLRIGSTERAVPLFGLLVLLRPDDARHWHALGVSCRKLGQHGAALAVFAEALARDPRRAQSALQMVEVMLAVGLRERALELVDMLDRACERMWDEPACRRLRGLRELLAAPLQ